MNPQVLLTVLEMQHGLVDGTQNDMSPDQIRSTIESTSLALAKSFYEHLYAFGSRSPKSSGGTSHEPLVPLADGNTVQLDPGLPSGTFALGVVLGTSSDLATWLSQVSTTGQHSFTQTFHNLFPESDPTSDTNFVDPPSAPPDSLLQFPFPLGATWIYGGPHSWNGDNNPPFSSMDFFLTGGHLRCTALLLCGVRCRWQRLSPIQLQLLDQITHGGGWTTSYYHLRNTLTGGSVERNWLMGSIACETCAGGYTTGPHVHFSLKYNGAYISLEGVKLSGWTVHVGPTAYTSGYIERGGVTINPYGSVLNDYQTYFPLSDHSLRFHGNGTGDIDRVKIQIDDPANSNPGPPVDVGSTDFTIEWWWSSVPEENDAGSISCGWNDNWVHGNTLLDRSRRDNDNDFGGLWPEGRSPLASAEPERATTRFVATILCMTGSGSSRSSAGAATDGCGSSSMASSMPKSTAPMVTSPTPTTGFPLTCAGHRAISPARQPIRTWLWERASWIGGVLIHPSVGGWTSCAYRTYGAIPAISQFPIRHSRPTRTHLASTTLTRVPGSHWMTCPDSRAARATVC